jgi:hypothetical protein
VLNAIRIIIYSKYCKFSQGKTLLSEDCKLQLSYTFLKLSIYNSSILTHSSCTVCIVVR